MPNQSGRAECLIVPDPDATYISAESHANYTDPDLGYIAGSQESSVEGTS